MNIVDHIINDVLCGIKATVRKEDGSSVQLDKLCPTGNALCASADGIKLSISFKSVGSKVVMYADLVSVFPLDATAIEWEFSTQTADKVLAFHHFDDLWMTFNFAKPGDALGNRTQNLVYQTEDKHVGITLLTGDIFSCQIDANKMYLTSGFGGYKEFHGAFLSAAISDIPMNALADAYKYARELGAIVVPLREERVYPKTFDGFGWCTWDAFYADVTADKIFAKLDEFKSKNINIKWMIIDDGWCLTDNGVMVDMIADPKKFPDGLKACVDRIKNEYGIEYVGVWHSLSGYWGGVKIGSKLAKDYEDALMIYGSGHLAPRDNPDEGFRFWDDFHGYLEDCGIDFVKVDNQSSSNSFLSCNMSAPDATRRIYESMERSINKHFNGVVINCMGMDMENVLARPYSAVNRNSIDFYPNKEKGFRFHAQQNIYNAVWHANIMYCDFDMWWTPEGCSNPQQSGVLRAISGGPVYISDKVGQTDSDAIYPISGNDGRVYKLDNNALPTLDIFYVNSRTDNVLLKTYNNYGDNLALALFNICDDTLNESFALDIIPIIDGNKEYIAYEYFTKKFTRVSKNTVINTSLDVDGVLSYSLYPIEADENGEYIILGDCDRYIGIATKDKKKVYVKELI